ncbi:MAG: S53 family peptidase [Rhodoluna sp.]|nr:S53 family peptidase [Rhodoluna sp.]
MLKPSKLVVSLISVGLLLGFTGSVASAAGHHVRAHDVHTCAKVTRGHAGCLAIRRNLLIDGVVPHAQSPAALLEPSGRTAFGLEALRKAYGVRIKGAKGFTVVVVDAFHAASAFADLNYYRGTWGLPPLADCTTTPATGVPCFRQVHQDGTPSVGQTDDLGWAQETVMDVELVSAMCTSCSITVVEADSTAFADFNKAVEQSILQPGTVAISNSYGGPEVSEKPFQAYEHAFAHGITVVASSGDSGFGVSSPASFKHVIAVGGTSLITKASGTYSSESAWKGSGSGCAKGSAPEWQDSTKTRCQGKAIADLAAVADPATGVAVFFDGEWLVFGGTSASAPIVAGLFAAKHRTAGVAGGKLTGGAMLWGGQKILHDVVSGTNGSCELFCSAGVGWDGPTGLGTPKGTGGF